MTSAKNFFLISGVIFLVSLIIPFNLLFKHKGKLQRTTKPVNAIVTKSWIQEILETAGDPTRPIGTYNIYQPVIEFEYAVNDKIYTLEYRPRGFNGKEYIDPKFAKEFLLNYPVGKTVTIYCNPDNPKEALAVKDANNFPYVLMGFFFLFFVVINIMRWFYVHG